MSDVTLCHFYSKNAANQRGCLLLREDCNGTKSKQECKFMKTTKEFYEESNRAIELNRKKGNCINCKYRKAKCDTVTIREDAK